MKDKSKRVAILIGITLSVGLALGFQSAGDHKLLFEKAKFAMETQGNLQGAIKLFQEIVAKYPQEKEYAAKAQLYVGLCYEKMGNSEAVKAYELVLRKFADRPEEVAVARERLATLRQEAVSGFSVAPIPLVGGNFEPVALSPDGTKMLGVDDESGENIAFYDMATSRKILLTHFDESDKSYYAEYPVWSPDGQSLAYVQSSNGRVAAGGHYTPPELRISTLDGKSRVLWAWPDDKKWIITCDWLGDGSAIVALLTNEDDTQTLGLVPLNGRPFKALFSIPADWAVGRPSASPDGRFIALESGPAGSRNIQVISVADQSSWVLADHPADDGDPRWAPDGRHIIFLSHRHGSWALWGLSVKDGKPGGQPFMIREGMPRGNLLNWTARGLVLSSWMDVKDVFIQAIDPETNGPIGRPQLLSYGQTGGNVSPSWSPDGKYLAFASTLGYSDPSSRGHLIVMPADGGQPREFPVPLTHPWSPLLYPDIRWLPDGSGLGYTIKNEKGQESLLQLNVASGEWKTFAIPTKFWTDIEWSGDGKSYYYAKHPYYGHVEPDPGIIEHNVETGKERYVYRPEKGKDSVFRSFRCSRDYKWLVIEQVDYVQNRTQEVCQILALEVESGKLQTVTPALEGPRPNDWLRFAWPAWSPDLKNLLVLCNNDKSSLAKEMGIISAAGGSLKKLPIALDWPAGEGFYSGFWTFDWSPDGKKIAFSVRSIKNETYLMRNVIAEKR